MKFLLWLENDSINKKLTLFNKNVFKRSIIFIGSKEKNQLSYYDFRIHTTRMSNLC